MKYALVLDNNNYYIQANQFVEFDLKTVLEVKEADNLYQAASEFGLLSKLNENNILVVGVRPAEPPRLEIISNELDSLQKYVGGYIEHGYSSKGNEYWVNDEGKLEKLPLNRAIINENQVVDITAGNMLFTMSNEDGETISCDEDYVKRVEEEFNLPQVFTYDRLSKDVKVIDITDYELASFLKDTGMTMYPADQVKDMYDIVMFHFGLAIEENDIEQEFGKDDIEL